MRTEVYSWRLSDELKSDLEREARLRKMSVSSVLDLAVREWLKKSALDVAGDAAQRELHEAADGCLGILAGRNRHRAEAAREAVRKRLRLHRRHHGR
jgi:predicted transcriptional regulator